MAGVNIHIPNVEDPVALRQTLMSIVRALEEGGGDYTDADAIYAINNDGDHGATASHNYFSGDHTDLSNVQSDDHHTKYSDADAEAAINNDSDHGSTAPHNYRPRWRLWIGT